MFRSGISLLQPPLTARRWLGSAATRTGVTASQPPPLPGLRSMLVSNSQHQIFSRRPQPYSLHRTSPWRALSTEKKGGEQQKNSAAGAENDATKEIGLTPGEKVVVASRLGMWAGIAAFAAVCAYYIGKELMPT